MSSPLEIQGQVGSGLKERFSLSFPLKTIPKNVPPKEITGPLKVGTRGRVHIDFGLVSLASI